MMVQDTVSGGNLRGEFFGGNLVGGAAEGDIGNEVCCCVRMEPWCHQSVKQQ